MRVVCILLLFVFVKVGLYSQLQNKLITHNKLNTEFACLYNNQDTIHIAGYAVNGLVDDINFKYLHSIYIPKNKTITSKLLKWNSGDYFTRKINLIKVGENYISCTQPSLVADTFHHGIIVVNGNGMLVSKREWSEGTKGGVYNHNIYANSDSSFVLYAQVDYRRPNTPYYNQVIYQLDKNFKILDSFFADSFNIVPKNELTIGGLAPTTPDNYLLVSNSAKFSCDINQLKYHTYLVEFDDNLKIKRKGAITDRNLLISNSLFVDKNSILIYGRLADSTYCKSNLQVEIGRPYIAMLDSNYKFKWEINFEKGKNPSIISLFSYNLERTIKLRDGNFLAVGNYDYPSALNPDKWEGRSGVLIKFDKNGNVIWSKKYRFDEAEYCAYTEFYLRDVAELSNGEIVAIGAVPLDCRSLDTNESPQRGWLLHLDSKGEIIKNQILSANLSNEIRVSPNPFGDNIQIYNLGKGNYSYCLFNTIGQKIKEENFYSIDGNHSIHFSNLPKGNYFLNIFDELHQIVSSHKLEKN